MKLLRNNGTTGSALEFIGITFAVTWACWTPILAGISSHTLLGSILLHLGTYAPSLVAIWLTSRNQGDAGVHALLGRVIPRSVAVRWYVFAVGYMAAIKLTAALVHRVVTGEWPPFGDLPWPFIPFVIAMSTPFQAGEEIGWRGYALPRLASRLGLARASLALGVIWALWHLPLFFLRAGDTYGQSFVVFLLQVTALSVAFAWLYVKANGCLLLPMLLHAAVNNTKDIVPSATPGATNVFGLSASLVAWLTVGLLWVCAGVFVVWMNRTEAQRAGTYGT